ncbi:MAG: DUF4402 domain-containing protein [Rhizobacter sp.]|nr:DUF4402 domain-containing protein [Burkholderiales bacterium]
MDILIKRPAQLLPNSPLASAFMLLALVTTADAFAAGSSSTAVATSMAPITIASTSILSFGRFVPSGSATTVTISNSGVRSGTGGIVLSNTQAASSAAVFTVSGQANATYSITHGGATVLTAPTGGAGIALSKTSDFTGKNVVSGQVSIGTLGAAPSAGAPGTQKIYVGGTIAVAPNQAPGTYSGDITVTVEYN